jgi:hypothetical protein
MVPPNPTTDSLVAAAQCLAGSLESSKPPFEFRIGWSDGYEQLFSERYEPVTSVDDLTDQAVSRGRVLLQAEAGAGKTSVVRQLIRGLNPEERLPVFVDLRTWTPEHDESWAVAGVNDLLRMRILLKQVAEPSTDEPTLASRQTPDALIVVDGLNEISSGIGNEILATLDAFARRNTQAGVIVTDRLVRRQLPSDEWGIATIERVRQPDATGESLAESNEQAEFLSKSALFLDLSLREGLDSTSSAKTLRKYLVDAAGLSEQDLDSASKAAFELYAHDARRTFTLERFSALAGEDVTTALLDAGVLRASGRAYFRHHLFHDYLAALTLIGDPELWKSETFDAITFYASSFDILGFALEEIPDAQSADEFLRSIYDWNYFGSSYALARGRRLGSVAVTHSMEIALLAMLGERRWDLISATAQLVEDALRLFPGEDALRMLTARDLEEIFSLVRETPAGDAMFERWRELFLRPSGGAISNTIVDQVRDRESLIGWTIANVLKRVRLDDDQQRRLRNLLLTDESRIVRWRAAHALGAHPTPDNMDALLTALADSYMWVRYGSLRSLVEIAARSADLRVEVFEHLTPRLVDLRSDRRPITEFERALALKEPPADWAEAVAPSIMALWSNSATIEEQDHWRELAHRVERATKVGFGG